jgi:hypothetical protein
MQIFVRADRTYTLDIEVLPPSMPLTTQSLDSIAQAKSLIGAKTGFPAISQRLLYSGVQLLDSQTLAGN